MKYENYQCQRVISFANHTAHGSFLNRFQTHLQVGRRVLARVGLPGNGIQYDRRSRESNLCPCSLVHAHGEYQQKLEALPGKQRYPGTHRRRLAAEVVTVMGSKHDPANVLALDRHREGCPQNKRMIGTALRVVVMGNKTCVCFNLIFGKSRRRYMYDG